MPDDNEPKPGLSIIDPSTSKFRAAVAWFRSSPAKMVVGGLSALAAVVLFGYLLFKPAKPSNMSMSVADSMPAAAPMTSAPMMSAPKTTPMVSKSKSKTVAHSKKAHSQKHKKTVKHHR